MGKKQVKTSQAQLKLERTWSVQFHYKKLKIEETTDANRSKSDGKKTFNKHTQVNTIWII